MRVPSAALKLGACLLLYLPSAQQSLDSSQKVHTRLHEFDPHSEQDITSACFETLTSSSCFGFRS